MMKFGETPVIIHIDRIIKRDHKYKMSCAAYSDSRYWQSHKPLSSGVTAVLV